MTLGKVDGKHFNISCARVGFSVFAPATRWTCAAAFGLGWRLVGRPEAFLPHISLFLVREHRPFARMWHLRHPYNIVRVGSWCR